MGILVKIVAMELVLSLSNPKQILMTMNLPMVRYGCKNFVFCSEINFTCLLLLLMLLGNETRGLGTIQLVFKFRKKFTFCCYFLLCHVECVKFEF